MKGEEGRGATLCNADRDKEREENVKEGWGKRRQSGEERT